MTVPVQGLGTGGSGHAVPAPRRRTAPRDFCKHQRDLLNISRAFCDCEYLVRSDSPPTEYIGSIQSSKTSSRTERFPGFTVPMSVLRQNLFGWAEWSARRPALGTRGPRRSTPAPFRRVGSPRAAREGGTLHAAIWEGCAMPRSIDIHILGPPRRIGCVKAIADYQQFFNAGAAQTEEGDCEVSRPSLDIRFPDRSEPCKPSWWADPLLVLYVARAATAVMFHDVAKSVYFPGSKHVEVHVRQEHDHF